jgi:hypothetical protein
MRRPSRDTSSSVLDNGRAERLSSFTTAAYPKAEIVRMRTILRFKQV